ncbi:MAG: hypothetical protein JO347_10185, partial [Candidatus Eremiobacteraeota bacterium]|nr:hypothetical protein [Candidatus Eremiobacteraeota bacterium]
MGYLILTFKQRPTAAARYAGALVALLFGLTIWIWTSVVLHLAANSSLAAAPAWPAALSAPLTVSFALFVAAIPCVWLGAVVHEAGHAIGATLAGERVVLIAVGPFVWRMRGYRPRFVIARRRGHFGFTMALPTSAARVREATLQTILSGPGASALWFIALSLAAYVLWRHASPSDNSLTVGVALLATASSVGLTQVFTNLDLLSGRDTYSDGHLLLEVLSRTPNAEFGMMHGLILGQSFSGVRPRDIDPAIIDATMRLAQTPDQQASAKWHAFYRALDRDDVDAARSHIAQAVALVGPAQIGIQPNILMDGAYFEARYQGNAEAARALAAKVDAKRVLPAIRLRADAAIRYAEGDFAGAQRSAGQTLAELRKLPRTGDVQ